MPANPIASFAISTDANGKTHLLINMKSEEDFTELSDMDNKALAAWILGKLKEGGINATVIPVHGKAFESPLSTPYSVVRGSALFYGGDDDILRLQGEFLLGKDDNTPEKLAKISQLLEAPGLLVKNESLVTATINPNEYEKAQGDFTKLITAAKSPVSSEELDNNGINPLFATAKDQEIYEKKLQLKGRQAKPASSGTDLEALSKLSLTGLMGKLEPRLLTPNDIKPVELVHLPLDELKGALKTLLDLPEVKALQHNSAKDALVVLLDKFDDPQIFNKQIEAFQKNTNALVDLSLAASTLKINKAPENSDSMEIILETMDYYKNHPLPETQGQKAVSIPKTSPPNHPMQSLVENASLPGNYALDVKDVEHASHYFDAGAKPAKRQNAAKSSDKQI